MGKEGEIPIRRNLTDLRRKLHQKVKRRMARRSDKYSLPAFLKFFSFLINYDIFCPIVFHAIVESPDLIICYFVVRIFMSFFNDRAKIGPIVYGSRTI